MDGNLCDLQHFGRHCSISSGTINQRGAIEFSGTFIEEQAQALVSCINFGLSPSYNDRFTFSEIASLVQHAHFKHAVSSAMS